MSNELQSIKWTPKAVLRKYDDDGNFLEELECYGNLLTTAGLSKLGKRLCNSAGYSVMDNTAIRLGVGDNSATATLADTDLSTGANKYYKALTGAPTELNGAMTFVASFGTSDANFAWNCWGIDYTIAGGSPASSSTPAGLVNRKVFSFGTKSSGTWVLTVTITLA